MVRTKDLLLIVVVVVMLAMAISATVASRLLKESQLQAVGLDAETTQVQYSAVEQSPTLNRADNIARLRALVAQGDVIESSPSVEVSPTPESDGVTDGTDSLSCPSPDDGIAVARTWPLEGVTLQLIGASRVVKQVAATEPVHTTASGTVAAPVTTAERTLLTLPAYPTKTVAPGCIDSEIIGVTTSGSLLFNGDAILYKNTPAGTLIGYARDGFPIYGVSGGEHDQCGGEDTPASYRYSLAPGATKFLSCFSAQPSSFSR